MILAFNKAVANDQDIHFYAHFTNDNFDAKVYQIAKEETDNLIQVDFWQNVKTNIAYDGNGNYIYTYSGYSSYGYKDLKDYIDYKELMRFLKETFQDNLFSYIDLADAIIKYVKSFDFEVEKFYKSYSAFNETRINIYISGLVNIKKSWVDKNFEDGDDEDEYDTLMQYDNGLYVHYDAYDERCMTLDQSEVDNDKILVNMKEI